MARNRKRKVFDVVAVVKDASRTHIGPVPPTKVVPHKHKRKPRFKEDLRDLTEV